MNQTRTFLLLGLLLVVYLLWTGWEQQFNAPIAAPPPAASTSTLAPQASAAPALVSVVPSAPTTTAESAAPAAALLPGSGAAYGQRIAVHTDVLDVTLDTAGGALVQARLLKYAVAPEQAQRVSLLDDSTSHYLVAQSGLVSSIAGAAPAVDALFKSARTSYSMASGQKQLNVDLTWSDPAQGIAVTKRYTFTRGSYVVQVQEQVRNLGKTPWTGNAWTQLVRTAPPAPPSHLFFLHDPSEYYSFTGGSWYSPQDKFSKLAFDEFAKHPLARSVQDGWIAFVQRYFVAAWIPARGSSAQFSSATFDVAGEPHYLLRSIGPAFSVAPGASAMQNMSLFVGPKLERALNAAAPGLELSVDYGIFTVISQPLHWVLVQLHRITHNWGLAIILLVLLIKAAFYWLSDKQYRSFAKMRKLTPRIKALQARYADDKTKMQQAMMELYQKEKANPVAGCLPMLVQIPVFFALYPVLIESVELRQAPFALWIHNLSAPDPYYVLPVLYAAVMLAQQMLTPAVGMDPTQAKIMKAMPILMAFFFAQFPAGLVLYYITNSVLGLLQQWYVTRQVMRADAAKTT
ncbi:MAG: membrane protein insertase YidC [Metallibacterium sp.]